MLRISFLSLLIGISLSAQTGTGGLTGLVTDATGGIVPESTIQLINEDSGAKLTTVTNEVGIYRFASLVPGSYRLEIEKIGFDRLVRRGVTVNVGQVTPIDLTLQVGQNTQTVTVEVSSPLVESQSSSQGQLVSRRMVSGLPMPNRAATALAALAPGVVMIDTGQGAENYPVFSIAGGRARNQNFTLDGGNVTNAVGLTRPQQMTSLPMDAMQEFRVISNSYSAEHGHSAGGVVVLSTRSGTNEFHGSAFEFLRNSVLDARNFFAAERPPLRLNQYGFTLGGPIRKDKTHFFGSWEQTRQVSSAIVLQTVPDAAQQGGDFSNLRNSAGQQIVIYDPATTAGRTRQPFANNVIPQNRFDPVSQAALVYWPSPNRAGTSTGANNFGANNNSALSRNIVVAKLDHQLRPNDQLTARYYINDSFIDNRGSFGKPVSDPDANFNDARIQSIMVGHTHIFRPTLINDLKVSYLQRKFLDYRYGADQNLAASLGLTGVTGAAFPTFTLPGYAALGGPANVSRTQTPIRDLQFLESLSWFRGKHAFKFGVEHRRGSNKEIRDRSSAGSFGISPLITSLPGVSGTGNSLASFLLGEVNSANLIVSDQILSRAYYWAGYVQDDWRITDRLTLNIGFRWETELPRRVDGDMQNSFDPYAINPISGTPGIVTFSGRNGLPRPAFNTDWNNIGPRAGFAWRLPGEVVLRGGAGIFYGPTVSNTIGDTASLGFSTNSTLVVSQAEILSAMQLRNGYPAIVRPPLDAGFGAVAPGQRSTTAVTFFERDRPTPISYQYNLSVQREIGRNNVVELGYMANISHHLTANDLSLNQVAPQLMGAGDAQARRPFPQFSNVSIINPAIGNSTYHGGFVRAERRFSSGFSFLAHYTFSKFIDDVVSSNEYGDPQSYMDAYNRRLDKGLSGSDVPHRLIVSGLYEVRQFKGNRILNTAAGGWKIGGFVTMQSGAPFSVITAANATNAFPAGAIRPNLIGNPVLSSDEQSLARWFNTAAFAAPPQFQFGNSPRSGLRGGSLQTVDMTLSKDFAIRERYHAEIRSEFYNLLNHANFDMPGHTLGNADFGAVLSARPGRAVQLGLRLSF